MKIMKTMRTVAKAIIVFCVLSAMLPIPAEEQSAMVFRFKYRKNDSYRILSKIHEDVYVNNEFDHHAEIVNRISVMVTDVKQDGSGVHQATFSTSEDATGAKSGKHFTLGENYDCSFTRSPEGIYTIGDQYFMPTVRDVPVFPEKAIKPGDTWTAPGHEAHDLRRSFNIKKPYIVPFTATYTYEGPVQEESGNNKSLYKFNVTYSLYYDSPDISKNTVGEIPEKTMGYSNQTIYWDAKKGAIDHYNENFRIVIETKTGTVFRFQGTAEAEVTDFNRTATPENVERVQNKIADLGLKNVTVASDKNGLTISLENIQFKPDSAELEESEKEKIQKLASILNEYKSNDILVSGHTALAGTEQARQELSEQRANSVADYLEEIGVRDRYHIFTKGLGSSVPIASNDTEEGRAQNRRVEITIMDK